MKKITLLVILLASIMFVLQVQAGPKSGKDVNVTNDSIGVNVTAVQPFQMRLGVEIEDGSHGGGGDIVTIPEGKQLVLEHVSAHVFGPSGQGYAGKIFYLGGEFWLVFHYQYTFAAGDILVASQPMRAYINGPEEIHYSIGRNQGLTGVATSTVTISGYLVDLPD